MQHTPCFLQENLEEFCFLIFLFFCAVCGLYVRFNVPETRNRTALEIAAEFRRMHGKSEEWQEAEAAQTPNKTACETKF